ncbi:erythromycin biosynthesis sensory transduction protein eryC1 [Candidatus Geothermarchaeota archaeon ex4572_27]|nr:MAG: erythromycin biosynthesis sensory transduction protein eryC1 [Candidatus Geothermarchaeota archaeon ex4572_27]
MSQRPEGYRIPLFRIRADEEVRRAIEKVLGSGRYVLGEETEAFEREFASYIGVRRAVATSSGTSALFLILKALGIGPGDEVVVPAFTFIASVTPVLMVGARPRFVDVDYETMTLDPEAVRRAVGERTKAIIAVHLFGHPADMSPILEVAEERGIYVIEDAAEAHGAKYRGRRVGSIGHAAFFSFYPTKNVTVLGDGGMVATNDEELAERVALLRHHGQVARDDYRMLGYNMKMSEIHAAIGRVELRRLDGRNEHRRRLARIYGEEIGDLLEIPVEKPWAYHVYHIYQVKLEERDRLRGYLAERGIETGVYYSRPVNVHGAIPPEYRGLRFPVAEELTRRVLALPMSHNHTEEEIAEVCSEIKRFFGVRG